MANRSTTTQDPGPRVEYLSWGQVLHGLRKIDLKWDGSKVYGVPKGGMILAGFMRHCEIVPTPNDADFILDDLVDSGKTMRRYHEKYPDTPFEALIDKRDPQNYYHGKWVCFPWEEENDPEDIPRRMLEYLGEDVNRNGLIGTPERVVRSWKEIYGGYNKRAEDILTISFDEECDEMVIMKNIDVFSTCEHHILPFIGKAHIAYIPSGNRVVGASKLSRLVDMYSRRLQIQERLTRQIAAALVDTLKPDGVAVLVDCVHLCMKIRGVSESQSSMQTSSMLGVFRKSDAARNEFLQRIR